MSTKTRVPAAARTLAILRTLARMGQPTTAATLARQVGIPRSSIYQLLEVLEADGFVIHYPEHARWGLGVASFELGSAYLRHDPLERVARPILANLAASANRLAPATAQLGILHGHEILYLLREAPKANLLVVTDVGVRLPAHLTASGRSLLAKLSADQLKAILPKGRLVNRTGDGPRDIATLRKLLEIERPLGYSFEDGHVTAGLSSIAAAATNHLQIPTASFALTFSQEHTSIELVENFAKLVISSADELSKRLGAH